MLRADCARGAIATAEDSERGVTRTYAITLRWRCYYAREREVMTRYGRSASQVRHRYVDEGKQRRAERRGEYCAV